MGRVEAPTAKYLITACEVARDLIKGCESLRSFESFMFGSSLHGIGSDYDILIVGPSGNILSLLKKELKIAGKNLPLDILYMLPSEASETDFVAKTGCIALAQLAKSKKS